MRFDYICDNMPDGLVLMDEEYFDELDEDMLYSFEILLDQLGETELTYDFAGEDWLTVRERESKLINDFCNAGKMFVALGDKDIENCQIEFVDHCEGTCISAPSGKLVMVNAGELIQCLLYPDLEMGKVLELNVDVGNYSVECKSIERIRLCKN
ncbi:MAG: hypothetical protein IKJ39_06005 [Lachnospiraceae bacterium]|nr:hypothetical protein [Lachnospiraceae bacterium]